MLLDRVHLLGEGAERASSKRDRAVQLEANERRAQLVFPAKRLFWFAADLDSGTSCLYIFGINCYTVALSSYTQTFIAFPSNESFISVNVLEMQQLV